MDFFFGLGGSRGAFYCAFGKPFGILWDTLGITLGHLGITLGPLGLLGTAPGCFWDPMLPDLAVFLTLWAQKLGQDANKYDF